MNKDYGFLSRRGFIAGIGASAVGASLVGTSGRASAFSLGGMFGGSGPSTRHVTPYVTSRDDFYLVAVNKSFRPSVTPNNVAGNWHLQIDGLSGEPDRHAWHDLMQQADKSVFKTFECIGNQVGGDLIGNARWQVMPLKHLLRSLPGFDHAKSVMFRSLDNFYSSVSIDRAMDDYAFIALQMNGAPLPAKHGFPARVMLPDLYGMKQPRWLTQIALQETANTTSYWEERGWAGSVPVKTMSRLDPPGKIKAGQSVTLTGVAYAGHRGVRGVEVSLDGGHNWVKCRVEHANKPDAWSLWRYDWNKPTRGHHKLMVRAIDGNGQVQTAKQTGTYPNGASGYDHMAVSVD